MTRDEENLQLMEQHRAGDKTALARLCKSNEKYVYWAANKYATVLSLEVDDLVNEAWLGFLYGVSKFDLAVNKSFIGYVGMYVLGRVRRAAARELNRPEEGDALEEITADGEISFWLEEALSALPARERAIIEARYLRDEDLKTIGTTNGVSLQRVHQLETKALNTLREVLA